VIELISIPPGLGGCMVINGRTCPVDTGCFFALAPGIIHSFDIRFSGRKTFIVLLVMTDKLVEMIGAFPGCPAKGVRERLAQLPLSIAGMAAEFHRMLSGLSRVRELEGQKTDSPMTDALNDMRILSEVFTHLISARPHAHSLVENSPVHAAMDLIEGRYQEDLTLDQIAAHCCLSRYHLSRLFKKHTGMSIWSFLNSVRVRRAQDLLWQGNGNVSQVSYKVGFSDPSYFAKVFAQFAGCSPKEWRLQGGVRPTGK